MSAKRSTGGRAHRFGGDWTKGKLNVIAGYLRSYTTVLKDKPSKEDPFVKGYIDAFAGTDRTDDADLEAEHHKLFQVHGCTPRT
jgi:hypothetical protein